MVSLKICNWWKAICDTKWLVLLAVFLTIFSNFLTIQAGSYVDNVPSAQPASDFILDNIGPYDVSIIFVWFLIITCYAYYLYALFYEPEKFYYYVTFAALLGVVRAGFIIFTHLKVPLDTLPVTYPLFFNLLSFNNDLFFSGHTSFPFLGFLIFKNKWMKGFMLFASIVLGASTLLMHRHYSIDVFAAFFITYGVYVLGVKLFARFRFGTS